MSECNSKQSLVPSHSTTEKQKESHTSSNRKAKKPVQAVLVAVVLLYLNN
jgi:hypothetical protein